MKKRAIAYTADIILGTTGEIIPRDRQRSEIERYARDNEIEIVAWFEDEIWTEELLARPGIKALCACEQDCDCVLVERTWCLSRIWPELRSFLQALERRHTRLESASMLWDCVSQQARHYYRRSQVKAPSRPQLTAVEPERSMPERAHVNRPMRLRFAGLLHRHT